MTKFQSLGQLEAANTTSKAVVETAGTTGTTVVHRHHPRATTQGELVNVLPPWGQPLTPQSEANRHARAKGRSQSAPTVTVLATLRTSVSPRSGPNNLLVRQPHSRLDPSQVMWLMLTNISLMNTTVPSWHLFLLVLISPM